MESNLSMLVNDGIDLSDNETLVVSKVIGGKCLKLFSSISY